MNYWHIRSIWLFVVHNMLRFQKVLKMYVKNIRSNSSWLSFDYSNRSIRFSIKGCGDPAKSKPYFEILFLVGFPSIRVLISASSSSFNTCHVSNLRYDCAIEQASCNSQSTIGVYLFRLQKPSHKFAFNITTPKKPFHNQNPPQINF